MALALHDQVHIIIGGFVALGRALAGVMAEQGARVALLARAQPLAGAADTDRTIHLGVRQPGLGWRSAGRDGARRSALSKHSTVLFRVLSSVRVNDLVARGVMNLLCRLRLLERTGRLHW